MESAEIVDPELQKKRDQVFFGATVTYRRSEGSELTVTLVGLDEAELAKGKISWISPIAKALLKAKIGDEVNVRTPSGSEKIEILAIRYESQTL